MLEREEGVGSGGRWKVGPFACVALTFERSVNSFLYCIQRCPFVSTHAQLADVGEGRLQCTGATRSAVLTSDMSPAVAVGSFARSAGPAHVRQQVSRDRSAKQPGSSPGPGPTSGALVGASAASSEIPRSLMVLPDHVILWLDVGVRFLGVGSLGAEECFQVL